MNKMFSNRLSPIVLKEREREREIMDNVTFNYEINRVVAGSSDR